MLYKNGLLLTMTALWANDKDAVLGKLRAHIKPCILLWLFLTSSAGSQLLSGSPCAETCCRQDEVCLLEDAGTGLCLPRCRPCAASEKTAKLCSEIVRQDSDARSVGQQSDGEGLQGPNEKWAPAIDLRIEFHAK